MTHLKLDFAWEHISDVSEKAFLIAFEEGRTVEFEFNGITCLMIPSDKAEIRKYTKR